MRRRELIVGISATAWPLTARTRPTADDPGGLPEPRFAERHSISGGRCTERDYRAAVPAGPRRGWLCRG